MIFICLILLGFSTDLYYFIQCLGSSTKICRVVLLLVMYIWKIIYNQEKKTVKIQKSVPLITVLPLLLIVVAFTNISPTSVLEACSWSVLCTETDFSYSERQPKRFCLPRPCCFFCLTLACEGKLTQASIPRKTAEFLSKFDIVNRETNELCLFCTALRKRNSQTLLMFP